MSSEFCPRERNHNIFFVFVMFCLDVLWIMDWNLTLFYDGAVTLCCVVMFIKRTTSTSRLCPCNGSHYGLLGDRAITAICNG